MSVAEIAQGLVDLCRQGKHLEAVNTYYSDNIVSVESGAPPGQSPETKGIDGVRGKNKWWVDNHEVHSAEANGPYVGDNQFAVQFKFDVTQKQTGQRFQMEEMGLYTVQNGKIVHEHFYYNAQANK